MVAAIERMARSVGQLVYSPISITEMRIASYKGTRMERDVRADASVAWDSYLPE
jgi:hypothetical protein